MASEMEQALRADLAEINSRAMDAIETADYLRQRIAVLEAAIRAHLESSFGSTWETRCRELKADEDYAWLASVLTDPRVVREGTRSAGA